MVRIPRLTSIRKKIILQYVLVIFLTLVLIQGTFFVLVHSYYYDGIEKNITSHVKVSSSVLDRYSAYRYIGMNAKASFIRENFAYNNAELQVLDENNIILTSTSGFNKNAAIHTPDVDISSKENRTGKYVYRDPETNEKIMALTYPYIYQGYEIGKLRYIVSLSRVDSILGDIYINSFLLGIGILIIVGGISITFAHSIIHPINKFMEASQKIAQGVFNIDLNENYTGELGDLSRTMNYMAKEIQKTEQLQHEFISSVSHELRTPLTSIKGWSEVMMMGPKPTEQETNQAFTIISQESDRLIALVESLLDFSRYEANQTKLNFGLCRIESLLANVLSQLQVKADKKNIQFVTSFEAPTPLPIDEHRMKQVFINIIHNAIKYSHENSTIHVSTSENEKQYVICVQDKGIGIKEQHLNKVYDLFFQEDSKKEGTGIGLAISKQIIHLHHGQLTLASKKNEGTTVTIILPKKMVQPS